MFKSKILVCVMEEIIFFIFYFFWKGDHISLKSTNTLGTSDGGITSKVPSLSEMIWGGMWEVGKKPRTFSTFVQFAKSCARVFDDLGVYCRCQVDKDVINSFPSSMSGWFFHWRHNWITNKVSPSKIIWWDSHS